METYNVTVDHSVPRSLSFVSSHFNIRKDAVEIHLESSESLQRNCKVLLRVKKMMGTT